MNIGCYLCKKITFVLCVGFAVTLYAQCELSPNHHITTEKNDANTLRLSSCGIIVPHTSRELYRFEDKILRQEVVGVAAKLRGLTFPSAYQCRGYFTDMTQTLPNSWACRAAELSADHGLITRANGIMRPTDFVTKSEAMAMMLTAVCMRPITNLQAQELTGKHALRMNGAEAWQKRVAGKYLQMSSIDIGDLSPNSCATRSEVFDFASIVLDYTGPNGECMSNICKSIDARSKKFMQNTALTNYVSIEDFLSDASDLDPPLNSAQNLDDFSTMLSDEYKIIGDITSFDELINSLELDPYLLGAKNLHELVEVLDEYESISDQIRALEWSDQEDVKDFLYELSFQNEFEGINSLGDLIESTQDLSNFEDILMPGDFLAAIELANTGIPFLDFVQSGGALGNLDEKYSDLPDIENISDLISHIDSYPGLNGISDEDELVAALTELPGFGEVDSVNDFLSIVDEIEGFDNFEDNFAAVMLMGEGATLEDALEGAKTANQFIETMKQHADFADDESIHDILGSLNDHVILQDVNDFIGLADVLRNYPEFSSAHSVGEVVGILEMYDRLIENAPGYSVFVNTNSPDSFINTVKKYAGFEHTKTIAEFISTLRSEFPEIFDQGEDDISLLLGEINRVLERIDPSDEDGDTLYNYQEDIDGNGNPADDDSDGDGIPNYLDSDDDGDGTLSKNEDINENGHLIDDDSDGDGIPNYLDTTE